MLCVGRMQSLRAVLNLGLWQRGSRLPPPRRGTRPSKRRRGYRGSLSPWRTSASRRRISRSPAQGDPWNTKSTHVPKGRGPFASFEAAAVDALTNCAPYAARNTDWSVGGLLTMLEQYNGLGYFNRGIPSPYIWSGTDQYTKGKYVADGKFDPNVVDKQLGCAGLILAMMEIDASIKFEAAGKVADVAVKLPATPSAPSLVNPARGSIGALIVGFVSSIFKRAA